MRLKCWQGGSACVEPARTRAGRLNDPQSRCSGSTCVWRKEGFVGRANQKIALSVKCRADSGVRALGTVDRYLAIVAQALLG